MIWLLFLVFFIALLIGFPVAFALAIASLAYMVTTGIPLIAIPQKMFAGLDIFVLLSIPGFILAGNLMNASGITQRIIGFCNALLGHIRGGLSLANIGASMLFGGISGTAISDTASIGSVMIPAMKKEGYSSEFSCAVTASSSTVGPIIPPSLPMIIAATITGLSVGKLFLAGAIPGLLLGLGFLLVSYRTSVKLNHPKGERVPFKNLIKSFYEAFWALMMTVVILVGIVSGVFTPTEASVVAVLYAMFVGFFIYKALHMRDLPNIMLRSAVTTASLMVLVGFANLFGWIMVVDQIPQLLADAMLDLTENKYLLILLINVLLIIVGAFLETIAALLILFPVLLGVATQVGIEPVQFGVIMVLNLVIGLTTPPMGVCLFVASGIGETSLEKVSKAGLPFLLVSLVVLLLVSYIPEISLFLPEWLMD